MGGLTENNYVLVLNDTNRGPQIIVQFANTLSERYFSCYTEL